MFAASRLLHLVSAVLVAIGFAQSPEFAQQYYQRLGGAIDALRPVVETFDAAAARSGLTRPDALLRLRSDETALVRDVGATTGDAVERYEDLLRQRAAMEGAGSLGKMAALLRYPDPQLLAATASDYVPAVPTTPVGIGAAALGFGLGWLIVAALFRMRRRSRRRREAGVPVP